MSKNCPKGYIRYNKGSKRDVIHGKCCEKEIHNPLPINCLMTENAENEKRKSLKTESKESKIKTALPPPPPPLSKEESVSILLPTEQLKRQLSTNIANQNAGDCFAHSATRVFLRMISREFFEKHKKNHSFVDLFHSSTKEDECDDLYLIKEHFSVFSKSHNIEQLCKNPGNYNSILMYFFLHKITIDKFDCNGGTPDYVLYYLLRVFNDMKKGHISLNQICNLGKPEYCTHLQEVIDTFSQIETTKYTANIMHYGTILFEQDVTASGLIERKEKFFDKIKEIIDLGLYVSLSINGIIPDLKAPTPTRPNARTYTNELSQSDFLHISNIYNNSNQTQLSYYSGNNHAVTIVDYDYSKPSNKVLKIKNSWGKPKHGNDIYIYINKNDLDLSPDQVSIKYLEPTNEYSLTDLSALNESILNELPTAEIMEDNNRWINFNKKWHILAIIFNSTNTINSFFEKYTNDALKVEDLIQNVLLMSSNAAVYDKFVSETILRNVFDCIIDNVKRYPTREYAKILYDGWMREINTNKAREIINHPQLNNYFEEELKRLFPKTCSESIFGSCLPNRLRHFSRRVGIGKKRNLTLKRKRKTKKIRK